MKHAHIRDLPRLLKKRPRFPRAPASERRYKGITFDSKAEMRRFKELELLVEPGDIVGFDYQRPFDLAGVIYTPDFLVATETKCWCEEVKPRIRNPRFRRETLRAFRRNARQMLTLHKMEVRLVEME